MRLGRGREGGECVGSGDAGIVLTGSGFGLTFPMKARVYAIERIIAPVF